MQPNPMPIITLTLICFVSFMAVSVPTVSFTLFCFVSFMVVSMPTISFTLNCLVSLMVVSVGAESKLNRLSVHSQKNQNKLTYICIKNLNISVNHTLPYWNHFKV